MYAHLLVALDGSEAAEQALPHVQALAEKFGSTVTLLRTVVPVETIMAETSTAGPAVGEVAPPMDPTPIIEAEESSATSYLTGIERRLRELGIDVRVEHPEGNASDVIVERATELHADLILMTTHGRTGLGRIVFGSTAEAVLRHAPCPVLIVRIHET
jgi:nucleotide-binding universal stress UspA family protein